MAGAGDGAERRGLRAGGMIAGRIGTSSAAAGCLFGLAYGDALGKPTEFLTVAEIVAPLRAGRPA